VRLLHVVATAQRRGAEVFAADLIGALGDDGLEQRVAVLRSDHAGLTYPAETTVLTGGWRLPGIRVDARVARGLRGVIRSWAPTVVQVHGGEPLKHVLLAAGGSDARVIYRRIGPAPSEIARGARRAAHAGLMRRAHLIVAVAGVIREEAIGTFGVHPDRVVTIRNAVDRSRLRPTKSGEAIRRELGVPVGAPLVTSLGALTPEKDPITHVEIVRRARRWVPDLFHLVVGDGPLRGRIEESSSGDVRRLIVTGPRGDVADLLAATDVLLVASRSEGLPGCVIEAGMLGVPTAAFAVGGIPEAVIDGETGVLVPPGQIEGLAAGLAGVVREPRRRRALGTAARERAQRHFDIDVVAPRYRALYQPTGPGR
jgi:glycosyltransferase involved in cell wall biosynthesis